MSNVIRALRREHADMARLLGALERQLDVFDQGARPDYDIVQGVIDYCLAYPDLYHHPKEDLVLERLRRRDPEAAAAIGELLPEHEALAELTRRLADAVESVLREAEVSREGMHELAREFLDFYRRHIAMEEGRFFPAALEVLSEQDWAEIEAQLGEREDPLFGGQPDQRFERLRQDVLAWEKADAEAGDAGTS